MNYLKLRFLSFLIATFSLLSLNVHAQILPVGSLQDEQLRLQMLLSDSISYSSINRPYSGITYKNFSDTPVTDFGWWNRPLQSSEIELISDFRLGINPIFIQNTVNSRFPYGENNQAAWYGRGTNTEFMGGFYITSQYFTMNIHPHIVYQENADFLHPRFIFRNPDGSLRYVAEGIQAQLDAPFRFGPDPYTTVDWGNSSIRLHYKNFESGFSTEPLWWGPANRYPLIMSNNASGIPHIFLGTREPVSIPYMGNIQFKWMVGYPEESQYYDGVGQGNTRFINAINFAYSPSLLNNLTVGFTRVYHLYEEDGFDIRNVLVILDPFRRSKLIQVQGADGQRQVRNQTASFYIHLLLPRANAEIYGEFYREDHSFDFRDFFVQPHHNSAYMFGFQKLFYAPFADFYKVNLEFTSLTMSQLQQVRNQTYYYTHSRIRHGHTNRGQILGAAIGPGSNSQFLSIDGYKNDYKYGLFVQRVANNDNFHFRRNPPEISPSRDFGDFFRHWVDLNVGLNFLYGPGPYYLNAGLVWTKSFNYGRFNYGNLEGIDQTNYEREDRTNLQFQVGLRYVF